jgi:hypothetical protein
MTRRLIVEADGGSRGNPGPAAYGSLVREAATGDVLIELAGHLGVATNNVAEYTGLLEGLRAAAEIDPTALVDAPVEVVWNLLTQPAEWGTFYDMRVTAVVPTGYGLEALALSCPQLEVLDLAWQQPTPHLARAAAAVARSMPALRTLWAWRPRMAAEDWHLGRHVALDGRDEQALLTWCAAALLSGAAAVANSGTDAHVRGHLRAAGCALLRVSAQRSGS